MSAALEIIPRAALSAEDWDAFVHASPDGYFLALSCWLELVQPLWDIVDKSFTVVRGGEALAQFALYDIPVEKRLVAGGWGWAGPLFAPGLSPAGMRKAGAALMEHAAAIARDCGATRLDTAYSPVTRRCLEQRWGVNPLLHLGFTDISTHSRVVDLREEEKRLWDNLSENTRRGIKKALAQGYSVRAEQWLPLADQYYAAHQETYARTGATCIDRRYFEGMAAITEPRGISRLMVVRGPDGEAAAFVNLGRHQDSVWYHTGCSFSRHLGSGAMPLGFWMGMLDAKARGCAWFDVGEVLLPFQPGKTGTLSLFKSKFGGEVHRYFRGTIRFDHAERC
jgi:hypothetical protein